MLVHTVKNSRKPHNCSKCGASIPIGTAYHWWQHLKQPMAIRCLDCGKPRPSELTISANKRVVLEAGERVDDRLERLENQLSQDNEEELKGFATELSTLLTSLSDGLETAANSYRTNADSMEPFFPHGNPQIITMRELADSIESWAWDMDSMAGELDGMVFGKECDLCDGIGQEQCDTCGSTGLQPCTHCSGPDKDCHWCKGSGKAYCEECGGEGSWECSGCNGTGSDFQDSVDTMLTLLIDLQITQPSM